MQDGLMKMRRVQSLMLPGHGSVTLEPGGLHLMLIGLTRALQLDEVILIELEFADGERVLVEAVVMMPGGSS
jgi:copper(I)-binding protein